MIAGHRDIGDGLPVVLVRPTRHQM